jgi:hypothetical protein
LDLLFALGLSAVASAKVEERKLQKGKFQRSAVLALEKAPVLSG